MKKIIITAVYLFTPLFCAGAATNILAFNSSNTELRDISGVPLYNGTPLSSNGDILQIGYYTQSTLSDPFLGEWVPIWGSRIGDKRFPKLSPGQFRVSDNVTANGLLGGTPLSIRFYDAPSITEATFFNAVSDTTGAWNWVTAFSETPLTLSFADSTLVWQDGSQSAFRTTIPVPEPDALTLIAAAGYLASTRRPRWRSRHCQND